jgi:hypothetical protein
MRITSYTDGLSALGDYQSENPSLPQLNEYQYENFFRMYLTENAQYFYNLQSFTVYFLDELDPLTYYEIDVVKSLPWTAISYNEYRTIDLWWLIAVVNKIYNPLEFPKAGSKLKILYPEYVRSVITKISNEIQ